MTSADLGPSLQLVTLLNLGVFLLSSLQTCWHLCTEVKMWIENAIGYREALQNAEMFL